jgi:hypothetical protein
VFESASERASPMKIQGKFRYSRNLLIPLKRPPPFSVSAAHEPPNPSICGCALLELCDGHFCVAETKRVEQKWPSSWPNGLHEFVSAIAARVKRAAKKKCFDESLT